jgi:hypothetical protein
MSMCECLNLILNGISTAYSYFLQNHVYNLKHVSGYVFPIYQLFN